MVIELVIYVSFFVNIILNSSKLKTIEQMVGHLYTFFCNISQKVENMANFRLIWNIKEHWSVINKNNKHGSLHFIFFMIFLEIKSANMLK